MSFFEKLKRGMGVEPAVLEVEEEEIEKKKELKQTSPKKQKRKKDPEFRKIAIKEIPAEKGEEELSEEAEEISGEKAKTEKAKWFEADGQLAVDVYQTEDDLVVQSAIAGVKYNELEITIEKDMMAIKGTRKKSIDEKGDYFTHECYWGAFSREIILPVEIDPGRASAEMKEGVLTIRLPKILREKKRKISVKG